MYLIRDRNDQVKKLDFVVRVIKNVISITTLKCTKLDEHSYEDFLSLNFALKDAHTYMHTHSIPFATSCARGKKLLKNTLSLCSFYSA